MRAAESLMPPFADDSAVFHHDASHHGIRLDEPFAARGKRERAGHVGGVYSIPGIHNFDFPSAAAGAAALSGVQSLLAGAAAVSAGAGAPGRGPAGVPSGEITPCRTSN